MDLQEKKYNEIYRGDSSKYDINLPDYKITSWNTPRGKKILVLGVGTGRDVRYLCEQNEVWGVDISERGLKIASKYVYKVLKRDLNRQLVGLPKNYFDIIVAKEILEHLDDSEKLMLNIRTLLRNNGYVVVDVPNHFYLGMRIRMFFGNNIIWKSLGHDHTEIFEEWNYMHKRFFTWKGFNRFVAKTGFRVSKTFWDFGTLSHYNEPETVLMYMRINHYNPLLINILSACWSVFNIIIPRNIRSFIVKLNPNLLSSCFYVHLKKH